MLRKNTLVSKANMSGTYDATAAPRVKKVMTQAINLMFDFLKNKVRVKVWLYENTTMSIEGQIIGFDEYMNLTIDDAVEVHKAGGSSSSSSSKVSQQRKPIGRIMLKGDTICLIQAANPE